MDYEKLPYKGGAKTEKKMPYAGGAKTEKLPNAVAGEAAKLFNGAPKATAAKRAVAVSRAKNSAILGKLKAKAAMAKSGGVVKTTPGAAPSGRSTTAPAPSMDKATAMRRDMMKKKAR